MTDEPSPFSNPFSEEETRKRRAKAEAEKCTLLYRTVSLFVDKLMPAIRRRPAADPKDVILGCGRDEKDLEETLAWNIYHEVLRTLEVCRERWHAVQAAEEMVQDDERNEYTRRNAKIVDPFAPMSGGAPPSANAAPARPPFHPGEPPLAAFQDLVADNSAGENDE